MGERRLQSPRFFIGSADQAYIEAAKAASVCLFGGGKRSNVGDLSAGDCVLYFAPDAKNSLKGSFISLATVTGNVEEHVFEGFRFKAWVRPADYKRVKPISLLHVTSFGHVHFEQVLGHAPRIEIEADEFYAIAKLMESEQNG